MAGDFGQDLIALLPNLRRFAISLCRSGDIADDLVQASCEKALANRQSFKPGTNMQAWLFKILRNCWIDRLRRLKTQGKSVDIATATDVVGTDGSATMENRLLLSATTRAMDNLSPQYREILILVCVQELSYADAALVLEVPVGTVMSRLARARIKISQQIGIEPVPDRSLNKSGILP